jgi:hypothetical protein
MRTNQPLPVVVGIDDSEAATAAARFGLDEARRRTAPLQLVTAAPRPSARLIALLDEQATLLLRHGQAIVEAAAAALRAEAGDVPVTAHAVGGPAGVGV